MKKPIQHLGFRRWQRSNLQITFYNEEVKRVATGMNIVSVCMYLFMLGHFIRAVVVMDVCGIWGGMRMLRINRRRFSFRFLFFLSFFFLSFWRRRIDTFDRRTSLTRSDSQLPHPVFYPRPS
ncbi:hypothetical protein QBC32DRAFT_51179 [Pseudoneurospora amorphoporcata]|uniref:Transmembrane protein n=1 Tax=Pseudoneurospora amorphoporcata TaxID=241081 RepID=A0AAN6P288_9PEZI|nr:hypothetical protein QBC32DRAFT_51179 [Pseudoneurospora amorphoporcata]